MQLNACPARHDSLDSVFSAMTTINDLDPCHYLPVDCAALRSIGWLGAQSEFVRCKASPEFFDKLKALCADPWQPVVSAGCHRCELCQFEAPAFHGNVLIPFQGHVYVAPIAVVHYVAAHWYCPPDEFIEAVLACPPMRSIHYYKALLANGGRSLMNPPTLEARRSRLNSDLPN